MLRTELNSLEKISLKYSLVLIDTCALKNFLPFKGVESSLEDDGEFIHLLENYLENRRNFYVTSRVLNEYRSLICDCYFFKNNPRKGNNEEELQQLFFKKIEENEQKKNIILSFKENNRILNLVKDKREIYNSLYEKYFSIAEEKGLSETDFDLFLSGAVLSKSRRGSAIISNDFGIVYVWNNFLKQEKTNLNEFGFIIRRGANHFEVLN